MPTKKPAPTRRSPGRRPKPAWQPVLDAVHGLEKRFDGRFQTMEGQFQALEKRVSAQIQALDGRVERGVESSRAMYEDMLAQNSMTIDAVNATAAATRNAIEERFEKLEAKVDALEAAFRSQGAEIQALRATVTALRAEVATLQADVNALQTAVQQNSVDIRALAERIRAVEGLEARLAQVERRLA